MYIAATIQSLQIRLNLQDFMSRRHVSMRDNPRMRALPTLVFDIDDTLVFSSVVKRKGDQIRIRIGRKRVYARVRPGTIKMLEILSGNFDIFFFTAALPEYANAIIDRIAPDTPMDRRLFKNDCIEYAGQMVKDLRIIARPLSRVLLIDDLFGSAMLQPDNLVRIAPWDGKEDDTVLIDELLPTLMSIAGDDDIVDAFRKAMRWGKFSGILDSECIEEG